MKTLIPFQNLRALRWDPLRELGEMENSLLQFFGRPARAVAANGNDSEHLTVPQWVPAVDITEDEKEYLIKAELPDLKKEDVKITVEDGEVTITGERKLEQEEKNRKFHRVERAYGSFMRSFTLPDEVNAEQVKAEFKDGVLSVHLPKDAKAKPETKQIQID